MALISVIVPVYNVATYLPECLDSLCLQSLKDLEIILIRFFQFFLYMIS